MVWVGSRPEAAVRIFVYPAVWATAVVRNLPIAIWPRPFSGLTP